MDTDNKQAVATDDQELAKVLENMNNNLGSAPALPPVADPASPGDSVLQFEDPASQAPVASVAEVPVPVPAPEPAFPVPAVTAPASTTSDPELDTIKKDALQELRPLVDKLNLPPEEKFDTLLLIIRSTDDKTLVATAHDVAKTIEDDARRAEALLDIIKEIDFFSNPQA